MPRRRSSAPPVTRGREQASAAEAEDEQHPVAGEHLLEPPGREAAETADLLRCIRERADQEQADDWAERQPRSAEDDRHEELERDGWPVRRRVRDLEQLDSEGARNAGDHGGSGEDPKACACDRYTEPRRGTPLIAGRGNAEPGRPGRDHRERENGEREERDPDHVVVGRRQRVAEHRRLRQHEALRSAGDPGERGQQE